MRLRARTLLVAIALATVATVLTAAPAHAIEVKQQTHLVSQFNSGHTGWVKIALEKNTSTNQARAHLGAWCQNASGTKVNCGNVQFKANDSFLDVQYWEESGGLWKYTDRDPLCPGSYNCSNTPPPTVLDTYTSWACTGEGSDQYRAVIYNVRIQDAFGQWGGWKTRTHPTWLGSFC